MNSLYKFWNKVRRKDLSDYRDFQLFKYHFYYRLIKDIIFICLGICMFIGFVLIRNEISRLNQLKKTPEQLTISVDSIFSVLNRMPPIKLKLVGDSIENIRNSGVISALDRLNQSLFKIDSSLNENIKILERQDEKLGTISRSLSKNTGSKEKTNWVSGKQLLVFLTSCLVFLIAFILLKYTCKELCACKKIFCVIASFVLTIVGVEINLVNFDIKIFDTLFSFGRARSINQLIINDENQILYKIDSIGPFNENEFLIQDTLISTCFINRMKVLFDSERTDLLYIIGNHDRRLIRQSKDGIELNSQLAYRRASWVDHLLKSEIPSIKNTETRIYQDCPKNLDKKMEPGYYLNDRFVKVIQVFSKTRSENY